MKGGGSFVQRHVSPARGWGWAGPRMGGGGAGDRTWRGLGSHVRKHGKRKNHKLYRHMDIFLTVVLHSGPNGFSFLFPYTLSSLARGKDPLEAGVGKRLGKRGWVTSWGAPNANVQPQSSRAVQQGARGRRDGLPMLARSCGRALGREAEGYPAWPAAPCPGRKGTDAKTGRGTKRLAMESTHVEDVDEEAVLRESSDSPRPDCCFLDTNNRTL